MASAVCSDPQRAAPVTAKALSQNRRSTPSKAFISQSGDNHLKSCNVVDRHKWLFNYINLVTDLFKGRVFIFLLMPASHKTCKESSRYIWVIRRDTQILPGKSSESTFISIKPAAPLSFFHLQTHVEMKSGHIPTLLDFRLRLIDVRLGSNRRKGLLFTFLREISGIT